MIVVSGATGKVGTALVAELQAQQLPFRALAHSPASYQRLKEQQVEAVDATQPGALGSVFASAERFFLLAPSSPEQAAIERDLVDAARQGGVRHVVKLSVLGADDPSVSLFHAHLESEQYIRQSGLGYTFLRPNAFMQNLVAVDAPTITQQRAIFNNSGDGLVSFVDTRDIAAVAVAALRDDSHIGQIYELTGPESLSYGAVAARLTDLLGEEVRYVALSDDAYQSALLQAGLPDWYALGLQELFRFYRLGNGQLTNDLIARVAGRPAHTIDAYLAEQRSLFAAKA